MNYIDARSHPRVITLPTPEAGISWIVTVL
jgi:hypothetical protein